MVVHRGMRKGEHKRIEVGKTHDVSSFISTSRSHHIARNFGYHAKVLGKSHVHVMRIKVPKGSPAVAVQNLKDSNWKSEKEVILPPGKLHVTHKTHVEMRNVDRYGSRSVIVHHAHYEPDKEDDKK